MLNFDKYKDKIIQSLNNGEDFLCELNETIIKNDCVNCKECKIKTLEWLCQEYVEPILSDEEKKILLDIINAIKPFTDVKPLILRGRRDKTKPYIVLCYGDEDICLPTFKDTMFENLELDKPYGLEELGL